MCRYCLQSIHFCIPSALVLIPSPFSGIPGDGRCMFRSVAHGACVRSGKPAPSERLQKELADELRTSVSSPWSQF